ncbi:hypothetical protein KSC_034750 [Ktedonobacter sp. SOSP1-52]|uniref:hypothetical protein n=1 Tax=Ktedonobacter sp. SOSP1-52 TaxID=2778366 RepID=UPI0019165E70|nr:hypothetical protein [Ktedonobacter sp. SOSP1-52]GHO64583.1 hypothetical protein KSC_034750 [Ktedonobacter sp. SOSP1-52]
MNLDIRTPRHEVHDEIKPVMQYMEREASHNQADILVEGVRSNGLAVSRMQEMLGAREHGQADILILANDILLDEKQRSELVRWTANTGAQVESLEGHPVLQAMGGVGAHY